MSLREDCHGLESLPLKLIIVAVVASMSIAVAADGLEGLRDKDFLRRARLQVDAIVAAAETVAVEGPGSARTLDLDFSSEGSLGFEGISVGDSTDGPGAASVVLLLSTGASVTGTAEDPPAWICSGGGQGLAIQSCTFGLRLECVLEGETFHVLASVV